MVPNSIKKLSFLVYGLGLTGQSVIRFFKKNNIKNYQIWDDTYNKLLRNKRPKSLSKALSRVNYIVLSPGVSLTKSKNKKKLKRYKHKIITDIDLIFLSQNFFKSIVITGTNGKSTTCEILKHVLRKNKYKTLLGGNIGTPVLDLKSNKKSFFIIEASSFQLAHSKFINPDYAILINITNDHIDWHGSMRHYTESKFKIFNLQKKNQYAFVNKNLVNSFKTKTFLGKLIIPNVLKYKKIKHKIDNQYIKSSINDENMSFILSLTNLLGIKQNSFLKSLSSFIGLNHRYEIFLKKENNIFINDSKATSFQATKYALKNSKNVYWILGGLPKKNDKIILKEIRKNIKKAYIVGKHINFFKKQIKNKVDYQVSGNIKKSIIQILRDIKSSKSQNNTILFSPAAASFDQFLNFEKRGDEFKKLSKFYARKYI